MKSLFAILICCTASLFACAQRQKAYGKTKVSADTTLSFRQPKPTVPVRLDLTITKQAVTPFFCRQEVKWEQALKFPLRIRLGSLDQANWLEQKGDRYQLFK